jgi:hypothetical protein
MNKRDASTGGVPLSFSKVYDFSTNGVPEPSRKKWNLMGEKILNW